MGSDELQVVVFTMEDESYGLPINVVKEIIRVPDITSLPNSRGCVKGVFNLRGNIIPVVDLRERFGLATKEKEDSRVVVLELSMTLGLLVDAVKSVLKIDATSIEAVPPGLTSGEFVQGIAKAQDGLIAIVETGFFTELTLTSIA